GGRAAKTWPIICSLQQGSFESGPCLPPSVCMLGHRTQEEVLLWISPLGHRKVCVGVCVCAYVCVGVCDSVHMCVCVNTCVCACTACVSVRCLPLECVIGFI